ncbi:hypothetical protein Tco_0144466 [Tanacetum coccineum]
MDESEPHRAYDFFTPGPLHSYAGYPNNTNGWIEADVPLLGELGEVGEPLGAKVDELLVDLVIDELAEPIVKVEEQMVSPVIDMKEDLAMLFGVEDEFSDDDFEGPEGDGRGVVDGTRHATSNASYASTEYLRVIEDLCTRMGNLVYGHGLLVKKVITVSDAEVADGIAIREIRLRIYIVEGQMQVMASQMTQAAVQHKDVQIQQLQTLVAEMSSRESTLMQCILGLDRRLADIERRPPEPQ